MRFLLRELPLLRYVVPPMKHTVVFLFGAVVSASLVSCTGQTRVFRQPSSAMEPTVLTGEKFTADMSEKARTRLGRGDIVILKESGQLVLKRIVAIQGDTIEGRDLKVFLNRTLLSEPYVQHTGKRPLGLATLEKFGPVTVTAGKLFVAGDNRDYSLDSRDPSFGLVSVSQVLGKPVSVIDSPMAGRAGTAIR